MGYSKKTILVLIIGIFLLTVLYFQLAPLQIVGWEYSQFCTPGITCETTQEMKDAGYSDCCAYLYPGDKTRYVVNRILCEYEPNEWDYTCSGCYWKYGQPYGCTEQQEDLCLLEPEQSQLEAQGYGGCVIKQYTQVRTGGTKFCVALVCSECPSNLKKELKAGQLTCVQCRTDLDCEWHQECSEQKCLTKSWAEPFVKLWEWLKGLFS